MDEEEHSENSDQVAPIDVKVTWKAILLSPYYFVKELLESWNGATGL